MSETSYWRGYSEFLYEQAGRLAKGMRVLDIGCGNGKGLELLAKHTTKQLVGIDHSIKAYNQAISLNRKRITFKLCEIKDLAKLRGKFGLITLFNTIEHLSSQQQKQALSEIGRLLAGNGTLMVATNNSLYTKVKNPFHVNELNGDQLQRLLKKDFKIKIYGIKQQFNPEFKREGVVNRVVSLGFGNVLMQEFVQPRIPESIKRFFNTTVLKLKPETVADFSVVRYTRRAENFLVICMHKLNE